MVNTFVLHDETDTDFSDTFRCYDNARLGKQRSETKIIVHALEDLDAVRAHFGWRQPPSTADEHLKTPEEVVRAFHKRIRMAQRHRRRYLALNVRLVRRWVDGELRIESAPVDSLPQVMKPASKVQSVDPNALHTAKEERIVQLGYLNHPAAKMWLGYTDALRLYYNSNIREWKSRVGARGRPFQNNSVVLTGRRLAELYEIDPSTVTMPWWTRTPHFYRSCRASLLRKAPKLYSFSTSKRYRKRGYVWVCDLSPEVNVRLLKGESVVVKSITGKAE